MIRFIKSVIMIVGLITILGMVAGWFWLGRHMHMPSLPAKAVIEIDLTKRIVERAQSSLPARWWSGQVIVFQEIVDALYSAAEDPRVLGVVVTLGDVELGMAQIQELSQSVQHLRACGKFAYAHAATLEGGIKDYYLATAFEMLAVQPMGTVALVGLQAEVPFVKKLLEKIGVTPQFEKREAYKTLPNSLTEDKFTPEHKASLESLLKDINQQLIQGISVARHLSQTDVETLMAKGPYTVQEAITNKLIDRVAFADEIRDMARERAGKNAEIIPFNLYNALKDKRPRLEASAKVAVIHAVGTIHEESIEQRGISPRLINRVFKEIYADKTIRAVVLRIDSGGGSSAAAETIWRAIVCCQRAGIPVVVSMSNVAASGGYLIAAPANYIFAEPATITGSIGVLSGKLVLKGLWDQMGVNWGTVAMTENAGMMSANREFTPHDRERLKTMVGTTYQLFMEKVAEGREMPLDQVRAVAGGRVWTGRQAIENKLVDELGGLHEAITYAKKLITDVPVEDIGVLHLPQPKSLGQQILILLGYLEAEEEGDFGFLVQSLQGLQTLHGWVAEVQQSAAPMSLATTPPQMK